MVELRQIPFVDCHHHLWDLTRNPVYPWLRGIAVEGGAGKGHLPRRYGVTEYLGDMRCARLVGSVHVEAGWDRGDPCGETEWLAACIEATGWPGAAVAYVDIAAENAASVLERQSGFDFVRGVRMRLAEDHRSLLALRPGQNPMVDPRWRRGFSLLAGHGFSFELQVVPALMGDAAALADAFPDTIVIVSHLGFPFAREPEGRAFWRNELARLAQRPNVAVKLSGFAMFSPEMDVSFLSPLVEQAVEIFGPQRAMVGSNFPVDLRTRRAEEYLGTLFGLFRGFSENERKMLFHETASRLYRIAT